MEEFYPNLRGCLQHLAITYDQETTDLPCARQVYMPHSLRNTLFAKHEEKQYYCPDPTFYPHDWDNPDALEGFEVPEGAQQWQVKMDIFLP